MKNSKVSKIGHGEIAESTSELVQSLKQYENLYQCEGEAYYADCRDIPRHCGEISYHVCKK